MRIFDFLALGFNVGLAINLVIIFFLATLSNSGVLITTNDFGEQKIEMILFPLFVAMGIIALIRMGLRIREKSK